MAIEPRGVPTYPVWVGNLRETVTQKDLHQLFSPFGQIASCKIMYDEVGVSKHFGFVNFFDEHEAEKAALGKAGFMLHGSRIKTKGPFVLREEKHYSPPLAGTSQKDYRPLTDCSFGTKCTKGGKCPYRHDESTWDNPLCQDWQDKKCFNINCPFRHPGGKEGSKDSPGVVRELFSLSDLLKCDGRCGVSSCGAHFESREDLDQHIRMIRKPQCRHCRAIFLTDADFQEHKRACPARLVSGSTDRSSFSSESADIEVLSSSSDSSDEDNPVISPPNISSQFLVQPQATIHKSASANVVSSSSPDKFKNGSRRFSESTNVQPNVTNPKKTKRAHRGGKRSRGKRKPSDSSSIKSEKTDSELFTLASGALTKDGLSFNEYDTQGNGDYDSQSEDEDDDEVEYSHTEIIRLMSLNEQDMYDSSEESEGGGAQSTKTGKKSRQKTLSKSSSSSSHSTPAKAHPRTQTEPVGVFWDIENCPVPMSKSAFSLAGKIRKVFFAGKREAEFMCVCDITKESKEVIDSLHKAQVTLVHVNAVAKNAADDKLRQSLRRFAHTYPAPSTVVLISGDVNFSPELNDLRYIHNITIVLLHNTLASDALKEFANTVINFDTFVEDVESPTFKQKPILPRIVIISNLPRGSVNTARIRNRLGQLSDNCGGKVLKVDCDKGTARILFRTNDWAVKSMKRMNGEDVYGSKIKTSLEPPTPYDTQRQLLENCQGPELSKTFPPRPPPPAKPANFPGFHSPRTPPRRVDPYPAPRGPHPQVGSPIRPYPPTRAPPHPAPIAMQPQYRPNTGSFPPSSRPNAPRPFGPPPSRPPLLPSSQLPKGPIPRPVGRILIFKIPPVAEANLDQLNGHVVSMRLEASVKASHYILWHNFLELEILLHVDFVQTAQARREDLIRTLYERGELKREIAQKFLEGCVTSISDVVQRHSLPWDVTLCGWSEDEEDERVVRSKVIALLRQCVPSYWTKWANFKKRYLDTYNSAISEMAVHNACRGAVQILGEASNTQSQVIVFYELSPLLKLGSNVQFHTQLKKKFVSFLSSRPDKRVKLLDFVREYRESNFGSLPVFSNGKLLQEILDTIPNVSLIGGRPSTIFVSLGAPGVSPALPPAQAPKNLSGIIASFRNLLMHCPQFELPLSRFQHDYQTFYHKSFRVSDYLPSESATTRQLLQACEGISLKEVKLANGKKETMVGLVQTESQLPQRGPTPVSRPTTPAHPPTTASGGRTLKDISELCAAFINLLVHSPNYEIPYTRFQHDYQTFYHKSFRVSDYLPSESATTRQLLQACEGISLKEVRLPNGKKEVMVGLLLTEPTPKGPRPASRSTTPALTTATKTTTTDTAAAAKTVATPAEPIPKEFVQLFRQECVEVLLSVPEHKILMVRFHEAYSKLKGHQLSLSKYKAKKLLHLVQAIPDVVKLTGDKDTKYMELVDCLGLCEKRIEQLLYSHPDHQISLDRFMLAYEKFHGEKLLFYGHSKLIKLLENLPSSTIQIHGSGGTRIVSLLPIKLFALEIADLLTAHPNGIAINAVVPSYKERFGRDLVVSKYGAAKLIRALEAITDVIEIRGTGPSRTIHLRPTPAIAAVRAPLLPTPPESILPPPHILVDEVTALMLNNSSTKMTIENVTRKYNEIFRLRNKQPPVDGTELVEALKKLDNFKVTAQHVQLVQSTDSPSRKKQGTTKQPTASNSTQGPDTLNTRVPSQTDLLQVQGFDEMPALVSVKSSSPSKSKQKTKASPLKDAERLSSETKRLLLSHREHALTLSELVECFREARDPARPTADQLYDCLTSCNVRGGAGKGENGEKFQISHIPFSVGDTMVQLNRPDCLWKLGQDLQYLFIYRPTANHTLPLSEVEELYAECYGWRLSPAVYGSPTLELLFDHKHVKAVVKLDQRTHLCSLSDTSRQSVLSALLTELVFQKGDQRNCPLESLSKLYQDYFECPLHLGCFGVDNVSALLKLPKLITQMTEDVLNSKLVLRLPTFVAEQVRLLLANNNGRVLVKDFEEMYTAKFGFQAEIDIKNVVEKSLIPFASHVVNFAGNRTWLVWAPTGRPYPPHRRRSGQTASVPDALSGQCYSKSGESFAEWPVFEVTSVPPATVEDSDPWDDIEAVSDTLPVSAKSSSQAEVITTQTPTPTVTSQSEVTIDSSPYGFLEEELGPELMAELISNAHPSNEEALNITSSQPDLFDYLEDDLPPKTDPALDETFEKLVLVSEAIARGDPLPVFDKEKHEERQSLEDRVPHETMDYLESGMNPEQVLEEFKKVKESSGGVLSSDQMDPFLTYFGELSGQAIERMEAAEKQKKPKKGAGKKKRTMAIRFPGQPSSNGSGPSQPVPNMTAPINGNNDRGTPLSSTSVQPVVSSTQDESFLDVSPINESVSNEGSNVVGVTVGVVSGHTTHSESTSEPHASDSTQVWSENVSGVASSKIASIRDKSVSDWRPFLLAAVDYSLTNEATSLDATDSSTEDDPDVD